MEQLSLMFRPVKTRRPRQNNEAVLIAFLRNKTDWVACHTIETFLKWSDRKVRKVASGSSYIIGRIGTEGYKYVLNATREEFEHFKNSRESSAREILEKVRRTERVYHAGRHYETPTP